MLPFGTPRRRRGDVVVPGFGLVWVRITLVDEAEAVASVLHATLAVD